MAKATPAKEAAAIEVVAPVPVNKSTSKNKKARQNHTVVTEWIEEGPINAPAPKSRKAAPVEEVEDDDDADDIDVELPDEVQAVLAEYNTGDGLIMEVNRLPHYHLNGKQDPASLVCCGDRDFDPNEYKNILRLYYAKEGVPNFFVLKLKSADRRWIPGGRIGPINVEAATIEEKARHGIYIAPPEHNGTPPPVALTYTAPSAPQEPIDRMAGIRETVSLLKEFQEIGLIPKLERSKEPVIVQQNPPPDAEATAFSTALKFASDTTREKIGDALVRKMLGTSGEPVPAEESLGSTVIKLSFDLLSQILPPLIPAGQQYLASRAQLEQMRIHHLQMQMQQQAHSLPEGVQGQQAPANFQPEPSVQQTAPSPIQQIAVQQQQPEPEEILFGLILKDCVNRQIVKPEVCAKNVLAFVDRHIQDDSGWTPFNPAVEIFLSVEVERILKFAAEQNPIAAKMASESDVLPWLKSVQDEIRKEWANDEEIESSKL